jgi:hypothetical protein
MSNRYTAEHLAPCRRSPVPPPGEGASRLLRKDDEKTVC